jgi:FemAB family protein
VFEFDDKLSTWYLLWLNNANKFFATHHLIVDLKLSLEEIRLGFRKSYKPLVNKALREYDITVCQENIGCLFEEFRLLHLHVAGKQTRSLKSWKVQQELIENNEAFLVTVRDHGTLVGAGFFTYTRDIGSYSVGVYKRELHDKPIGHGVQIKAIEYLKSKGCKKYYIGQKMTPLDENPPTDKEISISHFKEGFASLVQVHPHLEIKV